MYIRCGMAIDKDLPPRSDLREKTPWRGESVDASWTRLRRFSPSKLRTLTQSRKGKGMQRDPFDRRGWPTLPQLGPIPPHVCEIPSHFALPLCSPI